MKINTAALLLPVLFMLSSCAGRVPLDASVTPENAARLAEANTPELCGYKGRVSVKAAQGGESMSFNALLDKNCSGDVKIAFLGALNSVVARMNYSGGDFSVESSDTEIKRYLQVAGAVYAALVEKYLKSPLIVPGNGAELSVEDDSYVFTLDGGVKIYADRDFRLYKYSDGSSEYTYEWDGPLITSADLSGRDSRIIIRFLNRKAWKGREEGR